MQAWASGPGHRRMQEGRGLTLSKSQGCKSEIKVSRGQAPVEGSGEGPSRLLQLLGSGPRPPWVLHGHLPPTPCLSAPPLTDAAAGSGPHPSESHLQGPRLQMRPPSEVPGGHNLGGQRSPPWGTWVGRTDLRGPTRSPRPCPLPRAAPRAAGAPDGGQAHSLPVRQTVLRRCPSATVPPSPVTA